MAKLSYFFAVHDKVLNFITYQANFFSALLFLSKNLSETILLYQGD